MNLPNILKKPTTILFIVVVIVSIIFAVLAYRIVIRPEAQGQLSASPSPIGGTGNQPTGSSLPSNLNPSQILGIEGDAESSYPGIPWIRIAYPSCGGGQLSGSALKQAVQQFHKEKVRVLLTLCQQPDNVKIDRSGLNDAAQSMADAVQCGNEEMKRDASVAFLYMSPQHFAQFYDSCVQAVHAVNPHAATLLGSLDPHVGGVDYQPLLQQVQYLNQMQQAMNTQVHPGGHWNWHTQALGLIDSWHNGWNSAGYADSSVNSLYGLFTFWAQQFHVDLNAGQLGEHLWVVEGTGCFKGCGVDVNSPSQVAISHLLTLTTDVQTAMKYSVPFFYFTSKDFHDQGIDWPIGVLTAAGQPKPLRQDLSMGSRALTLSCPEGKITVVDQLQLLTRLYQHCSLPAGYINTITG